MGIKVQTPKAQFMGYVNQQLQARTQAVINIMIEAGHRAVAAQLQTRKSSGVYLTQTGNLQASIGFSVLYNGREVSQGGFEASEGTESGADGKKEGKSLLRDIETRSNNGIVLIVVAGMDYAVYVEDMGLNVLTTAELTADKLVAQINRRLNQ